MKVNGYWPGNLIFIIFTLLLSIFNCTVQDPLSIKREDGAITGRVLPLGITVNISVVQGAAEIASSTSDSLGYYRLADLKSGVYTLLFAAKGYGKHYENDVTVYDEATTSVKDVYLRSFPEQIVESQPLNGQDDFSLTAPFIIEFTQPMNESTVEEALTITPKIKGEMSWNFEATRLTILPQPQLLAATEYQIVLSTSAKTRYNEHLSFPFTISFSTSPVKVVRMVPLDGATGSSTNANIMLTFNSSIDKSTVENAFSITPETLGNITWLDNKNFVFTPGTLLEPEADYHLELSTSVMDIYGKSLSERFILYFSTERVRVLDYFPQNGATHVSRSTNIVINFNAAMDQMSVEESFSIFPVTSGQFQWENYSNIRFIPDQQLQPESHYIVSMNTSCRTASGKPLPELLEFTFITSP